MFNVLIRFELDMLLESANAAIKRVEELVEKMQDDTFKMENLSHIEDYFTRKQGYTALHIIYVHIYIYI